MVWVGRDLIDHLVPTPCHGQGHLLLEQVAQSLISGQKLYLKPAIVVVWGFSSVFWFKE